MLYATPHCVALQRFITLPFLLNIVLLVPSSSPHIKVILPPNSTSLEVTLIIIHLGGQGGYQFTKIKHFLIIILKAVMED